MLSSLLSFPVLGAICVSLVNSSKFQKQISLISAVATFLLSVVLWLTYNASFTKLQFIEKFSWLDALNLPLVIGVDGISIFFVVLTTFLSLLCLLSTWSVVKTRQKEFLMSFLLMETILIGVFVVTDVVWFYVLFESVLIPMFFLIGIAGSRERKIRAAYMFFVYTIAGSILMLIAVVFLQVRVGSTSFEVLRFFDFSSLEQKLLWFAFFLSFAGKIPMFPLHVWLPEAHVEAPTAGSVVLAGILLKLGSYGLIRVSLGIFGKISTFFLPFVFSLSSIGLVFASLTAIRQTDLKRIIAYTSVAHMNLVVLGIFSCTLQGIEGAILQSLSHGFVSSALFFCVGVVYDRYHTRLLAFYSGVALFMPYFIAFFLFFTMANIALPGTSSFVGEFMLLLGIYKANSWACLIGSSGMILGGAYSLWLFNRFAYGNFNYALKPMRDLVPREFLILALLALATLFFGLYPETLLKEFRFSLLALFT